METIREIIDERVIAWGVAAVNDGRATANLYPLARIIADNTGAKLHAQTIEKWRQGTRPGDEYLRRFAIGTAGPPYRGNPELPGLDRHAMLERLMRARGASLSGNDPGPELTQSWQDAPAPMRRIINQLLDTYVAEREHDRLELRRQVRREEGLDPDGPDDNGEDDGPNGPSGVAQA